MTATPEDCSYCAEWQRQHPDQPPRHACGPCERCGAPGHVGAHPRQAVSLCLCPRHWAALAAPGYHFELYHLIVPIVIGSFVAIIWPLLARLFG